MVEQELVVRPQHIDMLDRQVADLPFDALKSEVEHRNGTPRDGDSFRLIQGRERYQHLESDSISVCGLFRAAHHTATSWDGSSGGKKTTSPRESRAGASSCRHCVGASQ